MRWSDIPFHPPVTTLRWFAAIWVLLLSGLAGTAFPLARYYPDVASLPM